ncbi:MAG: hypothetical protein ABI577_02440 [bacterium]
MRIAGDFEERVAREFLARSGGMSTELAHLGAKLSEARSAVPPAVLLGSDSVHISPEARTVASATEAGLPATSTHVPSPAEFVEALRTVVQAATPEAAQIAGGLLATMVRNLALGAPNELMMTTSESGSLADAIVRLLLENSPDTPGQGGRSSGAARDIATLIRELVGLNPEQSASPTTSAPLERAAVEILLATIRWQATGGQQLASHSPAAEDTFPPALLSLVTGPAPLRRRPRPVKRDERHPEAWDELADEEQPSLADVDYPGEPREK